MKPVKVPTNSAKSVAIPTSTPLQTNNKKIIPSPENDAVKGPDTGLAADQKKNKKNCNTVDSKPNNNKKNNVLSEKGGKVKDQVSQFDSQVDEKDERQISKKEASAGLPHKGHGSKIHSTENTQNSSNISKLKAIEPKKHRSSSIGDPSKSHQYTENLPQNQAFKHQKDILTQFHVTPSNPPTNMVIEHENFKKIESNTSDMVTGKKKSNLEIVGAMQLGKKSLINYSPTNLKEIVGDNSFDSSFLHQQVSTPTNPRKRGATKEKNLGKAKRRINYALVDDFVMNDNTSNGNNNATITNNESQLNDTKKNDLTEIDYDQIGGKKAIKIAAAKNKSMIIAKPFEGNYSSLVTPLPEEKFEMLLSQLAEDIGIPIDFLQKTSSINLAEWSDIGFKLSERHSTLTKKIIEIRCKMINRFEILNNVINLHAESLENHGKFLEQRIGKLTSFGNEIVEEINE